MDFSRNYRCPWKSLWMFKPYKYVDGFIRKYIGNNSFIAYVDAMSLPAKLIISSPQCVSYNFIEEGSSSYFNIIPKIFLANDDVSNMLSPLRYDSKRRRLYDFILLASGVSIKNLSLPYMPQCYYHIESVSFYGFSENTFKGAQMKKIISWDSINNRFVFDKYYKLSNTTIWLGIPPQVEDVNIPLNDYYSGIEKLCIPHLKLNGVNKIFLKHHPVMVSNNREEEVSVFKRNGIAVEVIPDEICLETELIGENNVVVYTVFTSLIEYVLQMGNNTCYSIARYFPDYMKTVDNNIWDKVELL